MSSIIEQLRIMLQREHKAQHKELASIVTEMNKIKEVLDAIDEHGIEFTYMYVVNAVILAISCLICLGLILVKNSLINFMVKHQLRHALALGLNEISPLNPAGRT